MKTKKLTFSDAIEQVLLNNWYYAPLKLIYKEFSKYREKSGKTPDNTIQERVQRDTKFTKLGIEFMLWLNIWMNYQKKKKQKLK